MKVLLIDNGTTLLNKLEDLIPGQEIVHAWDDLSGVDYADFELIVLSGGSKFEIVGHENRLKDEMKIIKTSETPLVGICFGCELIAEAYGGILGKGKEDHHGIVEVEVLNQNEIFGGRKYLKVYEHHRWLIKTLPENFIALAKSADCFEAIKHKEKPIYGFQFHPEQLVEQTDGDEIFLNLFNQIRNNILSSSF